MMGLGQCGPCAAASRMGINSNGARGLGAVIMEPLKGTMGLGSMPAPAELLAGAGVFAPVAIMAGSAVSGGLLGGLSAGNWRGAGTGALLSAGLAGLGAGASVVGFSMQAEGGTIEVDTSAKVAGGAAALIGLGCLIWGGVRAYRTIKKRGR